MLNGILFSGVLLSSLMAVGLLLRKQLNLADRFLILLLSALAIVQLAVWQLQQGSTVNPLLFFAHQPALYCVGPLLFLYAKALSGNDAGSSLTAPYIGKHLSLAFVVLAISVLQWSYHEADEPLKANAWLYALCFAVGVGYVHQVYQTLEQFQHPASLLRIERFMLAAIMVSGLAVSLLALFTTWINQQLFYQVYGIAIYALLMAGYLFAIRYPGMSKLVTEVAIELEARAQRRSLLHKVDVEDRIETLNRLLRKEKLYQDEDLDLPSLAQRVDLSPHQLSQLLNERLQTNLPSYLKRFRVDAAKTLLMEKTGLSILDVGLQVGFNSLSAFYSAFNELEGMPPGQYRKQQRDTSKNNPLPDL